MLWPTIVAVRTLGGSGTTNEIVKTVIQQQDFTEEQQQVLLKNGPQTRLEFRLGWARSRLKSMGLLASSTRGVWTLTETDWSVDEQDVLRLDAEIRKARKPESAAQRTEKLWTSDDQQLDEDQAEQQLDSDQDWLDPHHGRLRPYRDPRSTGGDRAAACTLRPAGCARGGGAG
ncbi:MAG: hypothetical protein DIU79_05710 [Actinobacteria bacterium]|nr:MAG: hypothetical protein DIU79_05710 [Actinomycetota bacterium]